MDLAWSEVFKLWHFLSTILTSLRSNYVHILFQHVCPMAPIAAIEHSARGMGVRKGKGGKSRRSPPVKSGNFSGGPFCYFSQYRGLLATFFPHDGPFSPCGGLFSTFFSVWGPFFELTPLAKFLRATISTGHNYNEQGTGHRSSTTRSTRPVTRVDTLIELKCGSFTSSISTQSDRSTRKVKRLNRKVKRSNRKAKHWRDHHK